MFLGEIFTWWVFIPRQANASCHTGMFFKKKWFMCSKQSSMTECSRRSSSLLHQTRINQHFVNRLIFNNNFEHLFFHLNNSIYYEQHYLLSSYLIYIHFWLDPRPQLVPYNQLMQSYLSGRKSWTLSRKYFQNSNMRMNSQRPSNDYFIWFCLNKEKQIGIFRKQNQVNL